MKLEVLCLLSFLEDIRQDLTKTDEPLNAEDRVKINIEIWEFGIVLSMFYFGIANWDAYEAFATKGNTTDENHGQESHKSG